MNAHDFRHLYEDLTDQSSHFAWFGISAAASLFIYGLSYSVIMSASHPVYTDIFHQDKNHEALSHQSIHLSVITDDDLFLVASQNEVFRTSIKNPDLSSFKTFLQDKTKKRMHSVALSGRMSKSDFHVTIAASPRVSFQTLLPLLRVLSEVGFTKYSFQTNLVKPVDSEA